MMQIEISMSEYKILGRLTNGDRLYGVRPGLQYEFISENGERAEADSSAVLSLIEKTILKPSVQGAQLQFQGNLSDFSISQFKGPKPLPSGKQSPKR